MPAYVISEVEVLDADLAGQYRRLAATSIRLYGGRYVVRGAQPEAVEGEWPDARRVVIVEFPSLDDAHRWYRSPEYAGALDLRQKALWRRLLFVDGVER